MDKIIWRRGDDPPVIHDHVSFSMPSGSTRADIVSRIAEACGLRVEGIPKSFQQATYPRGRPIFGSAADYLDEIVSCEQNLYWTVVNGALRFDIRDTPITLSPFEELVGRMSAAGESREHIAAELDQQDFKPVNWLEGRARKSLADYNQKRSREAIHTFSEALMHRKPLWWTVAKMSRRGERPGVFKKRLELRKAVLKRFGRARQKWNRAHPQINRAADHLSTDSYG